MLDDGGWIKYVMNLFIEKIISSLLQIAVFSVIPLVWWLITARNKENFFSWIGLKRISGGKKTYFAIIIVSICFMILGAFTLYLLKDVNTATTDFYGQGFMAIPAILVYASLNTALPEEILFRGFLLKRLSNKFGFNTANIIQAILFGLLHGVMFNSLVRTTTMILIIIFTGVVAFFMGMINEVYSDGSILPSFIIHTIANIFSGICSAFLLI